MAKKQKNSKLLLASIAGILFLVIIAGLFFLASSTASSTSLILAYAAGLSMIFLPCTLPLAFIIVPMTMGKSPKKGLIMALLFGLGISITLAIYGVFIATAGAYFGLDNASRIMFAVAGTASILFGLSELGLLKFHLPGLSGATPTWIQNQSEYIRIFLLGLFLGNAGIGCPNPAFYVLLTYIASVGSALTGGWLAFIHGLGRATPLIFLAILGIIGINSLSWISSHKKSVDKWMGWGLLAIGAFILTIGIFGMPWWENSIFHATWNSLIFDLAPALAEKSDHSVAKGFLIAPLWAGWLLFLGVPLIGLWWAKAKGILSSSRASIVSIALIGLIILAASGALTATDSHGIGEAHQEINSHTH